MEQHNSKYSNKTLKHLSHKHHSAMVKLTQMGKDVITHNISMTETLDKYYSIYQVTTKHPISPAEPLILQVTETNIDFSIELQITQTYYTDSLYEYVLVPTLLVSLLSTTFDSFTGEATSEELLNSYGIETNMKSTNKVWWSLPDAKFKTIMDTLAKYTSTVGGGVSFFLDVKGIMRMVDMKTVFDSTNAVELDGTIINDSCNTDWHIRIPSKVNITCYTPETIIEEKLDLGPGAEGSYFITTTEEMAPHIKNIFINDFYLRHYTSHRITIRASLSFVPVGTRVMFRGTPFIVFESIVNLTELGNSVLVLCNPL